MTGWIITATDIDEQKRAEEAEQKARKKAEAANCEIMKDEFLATVSHELRTPLTAIVGWSSLLRSGALKGPKAEHGLATIARNAEAEKQVVEDILDASRIASGKMRVHLEPIDPAAVVDDAASTLRPLAKAKGIALEVELKSSGALMLGDPDRLWQVAWKLVFNAIKFTPSGGRVNVRFEQLGNRFILTISDTGEGIAPSLLPHVFAYFSQEDGTTKRKHGGLGLGLAIVRKLVELHGGSVSAASAGKGAGATFTVSLPSLAAAPGQLVPSAPRARAMSYDRSLLAGVRVLVITADADARILVAEVLERRGAAVFAVASAEEAVAFAAESTPDVVVGDLWAPGVDDPGFLRGMRTPDDRPLPAIALIDAAGAEHARQAISAGFEGYIAKPIHPAHLLAAVASLGRGGEGSAGRLG